MPAVPPSAGEYRVLDAGCGMDLRVELPANAHVVGIDISEAALARNATVDERIVGDVETFPFPDESFDLIVCHDVLEHLDDPVAATRNLARALKPGGELDVRMPIVWSTKGLLTKLTPHRFHVWCYRTLFGIKTAGQEGYAPFPTRLRITPRRLEQELADAGLEIVWVERWRQSGNLPPALELLWRFLGAVERVLPGHGATDYHGRFRKPPRHLAETQAVQ